MTDQIIVFDWKGKMAHFRQFDANSSSLSYSFPPPTVVTGMIAGLLGMQRDQYYDLLGPEKLKIGVQIKTPPRKIMQTMNYIFAKSPGDLNMSGENPHTQIPVELLAGPDFPNDLLCYRIILHTGDETLFRFIDESLRLKRYKYLPYLGSAPFQSWLEYVPVKSAQTIEGEAVVETVTALSAIDLPTLSMEPINDKPPAFFREHVRRFFTGHRQPGDVIDVVWERNRGKIKASFTEPLWQLELEDGPLTAALL